VQDFPGVGFLETVFNKCVSIVFEVQKLNRAASMIPVIVSAFGIGIVIARRFDV